MDSYDEVQGLGCLVWLLIVCGFGPLVLLGATYFALLHLCSSAPPLSIYRDAIFFKCSRVKIKSLRF